MDKNFLHLSRVSDLYRPVAERITDFREVERRLSPEEIARQVSRCMHCGIPFCHGSGCPLGNLIPDIHEQVRRGNLQNAWNLLASTSPMPEFTARVCPALCEGSCTAQLVSESVMIRQIEKYVVESAFAHHWVQPPRPRCENGRSIAIVGSGPAGLTAAIRLRQAGCRVTVFEQRPLPGGLLRYGIPAFKLDRAVIDRRIELLKDAGIVFRCDTTIGRDISREFLLRTHDAVLLATGTPSPRDLAVENRSLPGIEFALDFLNGTTSAAGKNVVIIGGGDTGADCVGMANRQGASNITQIEIMPEPPRERSFSTPWPQWPYLRRTSSSHQEGAIRRWGVQTVRFLERNGTVGAVEILPVDWEFSPNGRPLHFTPRIGEKEILAADLVLLAMGFLKPESIEAVPPLFVVGDAANGPSLVVRAMADAIRISQKVQQFLEV